MVDRNAPKTNNSCKFVSDPKPRPSMVEMGLKLSVLPHESRVELLNLQTAPATILYIMKL